ncbi:plasmid replication initiator TrfA [Thiomicrorhabdus indica]|uniref:plasmid replication initiator TrfA n=1 Tax=Thiomicrorhabdus indica TaxID=2267253 RepID=UPI0013EE9DAE|nr:plasmid replication initiator TrfA [Thiomicrorhabdus indica]
MGIQNTALQEKVNALSSQFHPDGTIKSKTPQNKPKQLSLPGWEDKSWGAPNAVLRGALFAATQGRNRRLCERELIATLEGYEIRYTGIQLTQSDLNLWEALLHLSRANPLGSEALFSAYEILKQLGKGTSKTDYESLKKSLARLRSADVEITIKNEKTYFGQLCGISGELDEKTDEYRFKFSGGLISLFDSGWSKIDFEQRQQLKDKPLALWLHGLYSSHARPYPMKIESIHKLCGSDTKQLKHFTASVKKAHQDLIEIGLLKKFEVSNGIVSVEKKATKSQLKHLKNKGEKK